ncbi:MAG: hypothetical protein HY784_17510 [Chloroflexi bacterium]|nr:hypothetical protein [Chloroflexota bacterium]
MCGQLAFCHLPLVRVPREGAREWIAGLEKTERERTGLKTLKVGYNKWPKWPACPGRSSTGRRKFWARSKPRPARR